MKKTIFFIFVSLFLSTTAFSQFVDEEAKKILDKTAQAIQKSTGSKADFSLSVKSGQTGEEQTFSGHIHLKGDKFKYAVSDTEAYYDGNTQWVYMADSKEVTISTPIAEDLEEINPTAIISSYKTGYKMKKEDDKTVNGKAAYIVNLYPEDRTKPYHRIELIVEKDNYNILSISTFGKNGVDTIIKLNKYEKNLNLSDNIFVFDKKKYPEVEIIDLR